MDTNLIEKLPDADFFRYTANRIFDLLDISENTRADYKARFHLFLEHIAKNGFNRNSFLDFKKELEKRTDWSTATKNKFLATAKIFLKELNRQGVIPADITQNIRTFKQSKNTREKG